ncbi:hypothetical protein GLAREA_01307 [Glarea lozoyensis ATCC 20868]|uniref:Uncharacterized protein n=1 Tax=Glarea lozoyensis (strain ATCC 20868 / MF5171) TaxID=1116229 RepID=S3CHR7_GLAL2|nr:uncharacterized protein GLAREA_01307 [Glarea lozoyensis ATCC 20868]EPE25395.1 hypothetical protein GLAREA_01307 [Glarea lozoyensis ATCC 20868]
MASNFDVATSAGSGDGNEYSKPPPVKSIAAEVLKKKRQLNNAIPPPPLQASFASNSSQFGTQQEEQQYLDDFEEDSTRNISNEQYQRSSNSSNNSINPGRTSSSSKLSAETVKTSITVPTAALISVIDSLLVSNPELEGYIKSKEALERRGNGYPEFPIPEFLYSNSCQTCLDHEDVCVVEQGSSSSKCTSCTRFGVRCLFVNVESPYSPLSRDVHMNCSRCRSWIVSSQPIREVKLPFSPSRYAINRRHVLPANTQISDKRVLDHTKQHILNPLLRAQKNSVPSSIAQNIQAKPVTNVQSSTTSNSGVQRGGQDTRLDNNLSRIATQKSQGLGSLFEKRAPRTLFGANGSSSTIAAQSFTSTVTYSESDRESDEACDGRSASEKTSGGRNLRKVYAVPWLPYDPVPASTTPFNPLIDQADRPALAVGPTIPSSSSPRISDNSQCQTRPSLTEELVDFAKINQARNTLRHGFEEAQGGMPPRLRKADLENHNKEEDEEANNELTDTERYWKQKAKESMNSYEGSFWTNHPRKHR